MDDAQDETPGQRIHRRRTALGLSLRQLATEAKVDRGHLSKIEAGNTTGVRPATFGAIESALSRLEEVVGMDTPDMITNRIILPDGTQVSFNGPAEGVAEAAARFLRERSEG